MAGLAGGTPFAELAKGVGESLGSTWDARILRESVQEDIEKLVDEIADWIGAARRPPKPDPSRYISAM